MLRKIGQIPLKVLSSRILSGLFLTLLCIGLYTFISGDDYGYFVLIGGQATMFEQIWENPQSLYSYSGEAIFHWGFLLSIVSPVVCFIASFKCHPIRLGITTNCLFLIHYLMCIWVIGQLMAIAA